ncbi:MAG TPA: M56 family metallopeptidase [Bryobacteraceae bacterium]|nr:M56 family metallopeptidase [Bryobacteraceae bacterium]
MTTLALWAAAASAAWSLALLYRRFALKSSAASRHFVLAAAFLTALLMPIGLLLLARAEPVRALRTTFVMVITPASAGPITSNVSRPLVQPSFDWHAALVWIWAIGAAIALARLLIALRRVTASALPAPERISERGQILATELGVARAVQYCQSPHAGIAETHGWLRPTIVVPPESADWDDERLDLVLRHELTHIVRHDWPVTVAASLSASLHWFNPLASYALNSLFQERELACDDDVLRQGVDGCDYATHLLGIVAGRQVNVQHPSVAMAQTSHLETRIRSLVSSDLIRGGVNMHVKIGAGTVAAGVLLMAAAVQAPAQGTAGLSGTVTDASSARVPSASVVVRDLASARTEIVLTNAAGEFAFASLPAGEYAVEVAKRGFKLWTQDKVTLVAGSAQNVSVMLDVGMLREVMDINGARSAAPAPPVTSAGPQRIRVGGNVQAAKLVKSVRPNYPAHLKEAGVQGSVLMDAVIGRDGTVRDLKVVNTQVHPDLAGVALETTRLWQYEPTYLNGVPVEILTKITMNFTLLP